MLKCYKMKKTWPCCCCYERCVYETKDLVSIGLVVVLDEGHKATSI